MITEIKGKCQYPDCEQDATTIAAGRESWRGSEPELPVGVYCDVHAEVAAEQGSPEYTHTCVNCGCRQGIN